MKTAWYDRLWFNAYELAARRPWLGTTVGLVLVGALVPILSAAGGSSGALGPSIPLFFLVPMLLASTLGGRVAGVIVSVAAIFCWDWFFIPPVHTVTIYYPRDLLALVIFLLDAILTGQLATVARRRAEEAIQRARTSEALYDLSVALIGSHDLARVLPVLTERLRQTFDLEASAILLHPPGRAAWKAGAVSGILPIDLDIERSRNVAGILSWVSTTGQTCSLNDTDRRIGPGGSGERRAEFWPLRVGERVVGVLELVFKRGTAMDAQRDRLLATLVNGAAIALEQDRLFHEEQEAALARESDRLKSALLSSVSHDLRTPLAGIKAATSSLLQTDVDWSEDDRRTFLTDIDAEADRLSRLVSNLLDLSRIEAGAIVPSKDWEDIGELMERVVHRIQEREPAHHIVVEVAPGLAPVRVDAVHVEQALTNLIENAAKYSPAGSPIEVKGQPSGGARAIEIAVTDHGVGIPPEEQTRIFDKFYRVAGTRRRVQGTGMGLAIVKGLIEANGGRVTVESEPGHGSTFRIILPVPEEATGVVPRPGTEAASAHNPAMPEAR
jgi:two-component system sensor histidine kinase KdpD